MKVLYALSGVGNGHTARAREIIPDLMALADVDVAVSGDTPNIALPVKPRFMLHGVGFSIGKRGGIDYIESARQMWLLNFFREVRELPIDEYDLLINDFEPVTARAAKRAGVPSVLLSHQAAFLSPNTPRPPRKNPMCELLFRIYAPCAARIGFHFARYDSFIHTPVIRREVRALEMSNSRHITVYLAAFEDQYLLDLFHKIPDVTWHVFSRYTKEAYQSQNVLVQPINNELYLQSLAACRGLLTGGGFDAPAEALFLGKNILVVPLRGQYEQICNAAALQKLGFPALTEISPQTLPIVAEWARAAAPRRFNFPDETREILAGLIAEHTPAPKRSVLTVQSDEAISPRTTTTDLQA